MEIEAEGEALDRAVREDRAKDESESISDSGGSQMLKSLEKSEL